MGASPKSKRSAPERRFEDYILTYEVGPEAGLYPIQSSVMKQIPGPVGEMSGNWDTSGANAVADIGIGFDFSMDGVTYKELQVSIHGWCLLRGPDPGDGFGLGSWEDSSTFSPGYPQGIKDEFLKYGFAPRKNIILAPWWTPMQTTYRSINDRGCEATFDPSFWYTPPSTEFALSDFFLIGGYQDFPELSDVEDWELFSKNPPTYPDYSLGKEIAVRMKKGRTTFFPGINADGGGVRYHRGQSTTDGRFLLLRWRNFSHPRIAIRTIVFDVVIYESGRIEFRYIPRLSGNKSNYFPGLEDGLYEQATCGIFASGTPGFNRYRDFGILLKEDSANPRGIYENGGAVFNGLFTDVSYPFTSMIPTKYTSSLISSKHWPGLRSFGATFRFSPPQNRSKQRKSITTLRDSMPFIGRGSSLFNDQLSISFGSQNVEYPSMLPTSFKARNNYSDPIAIQEMYQSGSITVQRSITPGLYDEALDAAFIEGKFRRGK